MPDAINPGSFRGDRLSTASPDMAAPGRALQGLGKAVAGLASEWQANNDKMAQYKSNLALEQWNTQQTLGYQSDLDTSAPDGSDFVPKRENNLIESYTKLRATITDPELAAKADLIFEQTRGNQLVKGVQDSKNKGRSYVLATTNDTIKQTIESGAIQTPEQYTDYFDNVVKPRIDSVIDDPLDRQKAYDIFGKGMGEELVKRNPQLAVPKAGTEQAGGGDAISKSATLLRKFEGFRSSTYWDVNAHRTGYGSDTITRADGSVVKVQKGMTVSRADAERDLARRAKEFQAVAAKQIGPAWGNLSADQQAALTSTTYNYGSLPDRVVNAAQGGNANDIANAVESLADHNGGVNASRRKAEADIIRGGKVAAGPVNSDKPTGGIWEYVSQEDWNRGVKEGQQQYATMIATSVPDELASLQFNGAYTERDPLTREDFIGAYGDKGDEKYADYESDRAVALQQFKYKDMTSEQIIADLNSRAEDVGTGDGAARKIKDISDLSNTAERIISERDKSRAEYLKDVERRSSAAAAGQVAIANDREQRYVDMQREKAASIVAANAAMKQRREDPATYVLNTNHGVRMAWREFNANDPSSGEAVIAATIAAQEQLGIPSDEIQPLPKAQAEAVAKIITDPDKPADDRLNTLVGMVSQVRNPDHQRAIFRQLASAGVPKTAEAVVEAHMRGDTGAANRLFEASVLDKENLPGKAKREPGFDDSLNDALYGTDTPGQLLYGLDYVDPAGAEMASRDFELAKSAATLNMARGMDQSAAIAQAVKDIHGDVKRLDDEFPDGGGILGVVPSNVDQDALQAGMERAMGTVAQSVTDLAQRTMMSGSPDVGSGTKAVLDEAMNFNLSDIMAEGRFRNYGDGWAFFDPYTGAYVPGPDGKPLKWTTDDFINLSRFGETGGGSGY